MIQTIRPISPSEAAVLERALQVGALPSPSEAALASISDLRVTASCKCGCATVWFGPKGDAANGTMAAETCGTWADQTVGVIVWVDDDQIVGLEVVGAGAVGLPDPASVRPYEEYFRATSG
jgi:hypothetical protein